VFSLRAVKCSLRAPRSRSCRPHHSAFRIPHLAQYRPLPAHLSTINATPAPTSTPAPTRPRTSHLPLSRCPLLVASNSNTRQQCAGPRPHAERCWAAVQWRRRSGPRRRCRHRGAVLGGRALPGAVTRARLGPPSGWSPVARMSGRRPGRSLPCPRPQSHRGDVRPTGRADVQRPRVRCPVHPGVRTDRPPVSAALPPGCPRRAGPWSGSVWRAAPSRAQRVDVPPWSAGGVVACLHRV
jgi:hypothetical protein